MRRAWLFAVLAAPVMALAQTPPQATAGNITVGEVAHSSTDNFINAAECNGPGIVHLGWQITGTFPIGGVTYKLYAADKSTSGECPKQPDASISLIAHEVASVVAPVGTNNPVADATYATSAIVTAAGKDACNQTTAESIYLCAEGMDPNSTSTTAVGQARVTITLDRRPPGTPGGVFAESGDEAVNVFWDALPSTADPTADYYLVDAQPVSTTVPLDPTPIHTSAPVVGSPRPYRFGGLVNTVVYRVRVFAFSPADNRSPDPTYDVTAQALPSADFWESYKAAGGQEQGGCASGPAGLVAIAGAAAVLALAALRRRR